MTLSIGEHAPALHGEDEIGNPVFIPSLERWTHVWFGPFFMRYGCRECETSLMHERYPDLRAEGCFVYCATYDPPEANRRRNSPHVWRVPMIQISKEQAATWGVLRRPADAWYEYMPLSHGYLIDPTGVIVQTYPNPDPSIHADLVLRDIRKLRRTETGDRHAVRSGSAG